MSKEINITVAAAEIVRRWPELARDGLINREASIAGILQNARTDEGGTQELRKLVQTETSSTAGLCVWNTSYPIIKSLGNGWHLVAHPNGPAIARADNWQYLGHLAKHWTDNQDDVPPAIRYAAVEALMNWAVNQPTYPPA